MKVIIPEPAVLVFLAYILVFLPWMTFHNLKKSRCAPEPSEQASQSWLSIWTWTLVQHGVLLFLAWLASRGSVTGIFSAPAFEKSDGLYALAALAGCLVLGYLSGSLDSKNADNKKSATDSWLKTTSGRKAAKLITVLAASVAEEAAYRGAGFVFLWSLSGNPWLAAIVSAMAFAYVHSGQGWKNAFLILLIALILQGLVAVTNTLVYAMIVHGVFDLVAFYRINRETAAP